MFPFSHSDGNKPVLKAYLKFISNGLKIVKQHVSNMCTLMLLWPWALLGLKFWIILPIFSCEKLTVDRRLLVLKVKLVGSSLSFLIREHCLVKKELKSSAFSLKSVKKQFSWNKKGIRGIILLFKKPLNNETSKLSSLLQY